MARPWSAEVLTTPSRFGGRYEECARFAASRHDVTRSVALVNVVRVLQMIMRLIACEVGAQFIAPVVQFIARNMWFMGSRPFGPQEDERGAR